MKARLAIVLMLISALTGMTGCGTDRDVVPTDDTVEIVGETIGSGRPVSAGEIVTISYTVRLPNGSVVLEDDEYRFELDRGSVIQGIDQGVRGMRVGGRRVIECPPHKHWGRAGYGEGAIPENTSLLIEIRLRDAE